VRNMIRFVFCLIGPCLAACPTGLYAQETGRKVNTKDTEIQGDWTVIYLKQWTGLEDKDSMDSRFLPTKLRFARGRIEQDKQPMHSDSTGYELDPDAQPWVVDFFKLDSKGREIEKTRSEALYYLKDDFLMISYGTPRPRRFSISAESKPYIVVYRRGKFEAPWVSQTFAKESLPKEDESIEATWTKIYYEGQGFFFSLVNMEDLTTTHRSTQRKVPFSEYIPLEWRISKNTIDERAEADEEPVRRFAYQLNPQEGALDMIPLDKRGTKIEKSKKEAVYFVKDDFLFVRYQLEPQRWRLSRPDRVFTSDTESKTGLLIFRRGPVKLLR
jgi:hypothetical protein